MWSAGAYPQYRIPVIVRSKSGVLLAFAEARLAGDHSENDIVLRRSTDGGATWGSLQPVAAMAGDSLNDPCVIALESGRILLLFQRFPKGYHTRTMKHTKQAELGYGGLKNTQSFLTYSDDDGVSWSTLRDVTRDLRSEDAIAVGSPGVGPELTEGPKRGRLLFPIYETIPTEDGDRYWKVRAAYSGDGGATWRLGARVPHEGLAGHANECQLVELPGGAVHMNARNQGGAPCRKVAVSRDGGESWEVMRESPEVLTPACMGSVVRQAKDGGVGKLVLSVPNTADKRLNGTAFVSDDHGESWLPLRVIYPKGFAYSCLVPLPDGRIGCLFERDSHAHISYTVFSVD